MTNSAWLTSHGGHLGYVLQHSLEWLHVRPRAIRNCNLHALLASSKPCAAADSPKRLFRHDVQGADSTVHVYSRLPTGVPWPQDTSRSPTWRNNGTASLSKWHVCVLLACITHGKQAFCCCSCTPATARSSFASCSPKWWQPAGSTPRTSHSPPPTLRPQR
jgi:hypothetical protein